MPDVLQTAYRIELTPWDDDNWKLEIKWEAKEWYKHYWRKMDNGDEVARSYLARSKQERECVDDQPVVEKVVELCRCENGLYKNGLHCQRAPGQPHAAIACRSKIPRCPFYAQNELLLYYDDYFLLQARHKPCRDLLLLPNPTPAKKPYNFRKHYSNAELVCLPLFWKNVVLITALISAEAGTDKPVQKVAVNFGKWVSASAAYEGATGHGHAHIISAAFMYMFHLSLYLRVIYVFVGHFADVFFVMCAYVYVSAVC